MKYHLELALSRKTFIEILHKILFPGSQKIQPASITKTGLLMLYREIIAVCSEIHTKQINTLCGQNVELLSVKLAVHEVTTGP
jgi:uncharacterized membrane protein (DUF373 family)